MAGFEATNLGDDRGHYRSLCHRCCNEGLAARSGFPFHHVDFEPLEVHDFAETPHWFHFTVRLLGDKVALDAWELVNGRPDGYQFQVLGPAEVDLFELMGRMVTRVRRILAVQHLQGDAESGLQIADMIVRGRIDSDPNSECRLPLLNIDGKPVSWEELGRMVMTYEGFHFRIELKDKSEEV